MTIATVKTIKRNDPVREAFSGCSSGNGPDSYYDTKGHAIRAFDDVLADHGYHLDTMDCNAWSGNEGRNTVDIYNEDAEFVGYAVFYYYRMESGRYEFVAYIA